MRPGRARLRDDLYRRLAHRLQRLSNRWRLPGRSSDLATAIDAREATAGLLAAALEAWRVATRPTPSSPRRRRPRADRRRVRLRDNRVSRGRPAAAGRAHGSGVDSRGPRQRLGGGPSRERRRRLIEAAAGLPRTSLPWPGRSPSGRGSRRRGPAHRTVRETAGRTEALRTQLLDSLSDWAPVREAHELAVEVASFAEGKAADNRAQMRCRPTCCRGVLARSSTRPTSGSPG